MSHIVTRTITSGFHHHSTKIMCPGANMNTNTEKTTNTDSLKNRKKHTCTLISVPQGRIGSDTEISHHFCSVVVSECVLRDGKLDVNAGLYVVKTYMLMIKEFTS